MVRLAYRMKNIIRSTNNLESELRIESSQLNIPRLQKIIEEHIQII